VGGVVGGLAGLAAIIGLALYIRHRHSTHPRHQTSISGALVVHEEHLFPRVEPLFDSAPTRAVGIQQIHTSFPNEKTAIKLLPMRAAIDRGVEYLNGNENPSAQDTPDFSTLSGSDTVSNPSDESTQDMLAEQLADIVLERIRRGINETPPGYKHGHV
jgi:hypothetical protein